MVLIHFMVKELEDFGENLKEGDSVTIGLIIEHPSQLPIVRMTIIDKNKKSKIIDFQPVQGISGTLDFMAFKVGEKKKRLKFPFDVESFEIGFPSGFKATFKKKE